MRGGQADKGKKFVLVTFQQWECRSANQPAHTKAHETQSPHWVAGARFNYELFHLFSEPLSCLHHVFLGAILVTSWE